MASDRVILRVFVWMAMYLAWCLKISSAVVAQTPSHLFETISVYTGGAMTFGYTTLSEQWNPKYGAEVSVSTPFYLGQAEGGVMRFQYESRTRDVPRFDVTYMFVGWGVSLQPFPPLLWYNGIRTGNYRMTFDKKELSGIKNENELAVSLLSRLDVSVSSDWSIYTAVRFDQAYTHIRFRQYFLTFGLTYRLSTPSWLKAFLQ